MKRPLSLVLCIAIPLVILLCGLALAGAIGYRAIPPLFEESGRGLVPPGFTVELDEAGRHVVWLYGYGTLAGQTYEAGDGLPPGAKLYVFDLATQQPLVVSDWITASRSYGGETAVAVGRFETNRDGAAVEIRVAGMSRPAVMSVAPRRTEEAVQVALTLAGILVLSLFFAIVSLIVLLHRRNRQVDAASRR